MRKLAVVEKLCLDCGDKIRGRADKKFCSDQCRNNYNNRLNRDSTNLIRNIHALLRKNRRILATLHDGEKEALHKDALYALGFNFGFFTHLVESVGGEKTYYCYEYGYSDTDGDFVRIELNKSISELYGYNEDYEE